MTIHVVKQGETITSIANQYGLSADLIIKVNGLPNPDNLVVGQSILILYPDTTHTVVSGDTISSIATEYNVSQTQILQNNPWIVETGLIPGTIVVISFKDKENLSTVIINGYAYPFIDRTVLNKTFPFLTYLSIFTYGFTPEGELVPPDNDEELIELAISYNVAPIMMLAPMDANQTFSNEIAHNLFANPTGQQTLINNILANIQAKNYKGIDIDFEFVLPEDKDAFVSFIADVKAKLEPEGYIVMTALAPKTSGEQSGLLYTAHDYPSIGAIADLVLLMTYEWGYTLAHAG